MPGTVYALLVGIDDYKAGVRPLKGCVNDINAIETLLHARCAGGDYDWAPRVLRNEEATRERIIDGFRSHLCRAGANDVALFYFSGHGAQEDAPAEWWPVEPDRMNETLVCYDSRTDGGWDLADKELAKLLTGVAERDPHIVVILDCCHSGSGTRADEEENVRRAPTDTRRRPLESYIVAVDEVQPQPGATRGEDAPLGDWVTLPRGRHVLIAACRDDELAKEYQGGGQHRGTLSYFLTDTLQRSHTEISYRDLFKRTDAMVRNAVRRQSPQLEVSQGTLLGERFLGGAVVGRTPYFTVSYSRRDGWVLDGGAVHGIATPSGGEGGTTTLVLWPFDAAAEQMEDLSTGVGDAEIVEVLPQTSKVRVWMRDASEPDTGTTYRGIVTSRPLPPLSIRLDGDESGVQLLRTTLEQSGPQDKPSPYVREAGAGEPSLLRVEARDSQYRITRVSEARPLAVNIEGYTPQSAAQVVARLEHIERWQTVYQLANPDTRIAPGTVEVKLECVISMPTRDPRSAVTEPVPTNTRARLTYGYEDETWQAPLIKISLKNTGSRDLYCALVGVSEDYSVFARFFPSGGVWLKSGQEIAADEGYPIEIKVPDELYAAGLTEFTDMLKLIASTVEFDATLLEQDALDLEYEPRETTRNGGEPANTLDRLLSRVGTRVFVMRNRDGRYADWTTSETLLTAVRPLDAAPVPSGTATVELGTGVILAGHPQLKAVARLVAVEEAGRAAGNLLVPPILRDDPRRAEPLDLVVTRGDASVNVLELSEVEDHGVVSREQPLVVRLAQTHPPDEHILPVAWDGEFFVPLGHGRSVDGQVEITLERLPAPTTGTTRDLKGSIRIMFHKLAGRRLPLEYPYPLLAVAYVADDGAVTYWARSEEVRQRVADAERIVLYVHGIIGDTRGMVASARHFAPMPEPPLRLLAGHYDLMLAFDYENINTSIEDNARSLKQRLVDVGLGPNHGKHVHVVAHSMGGLVSRWFVEREGGNEIVEHLIMLGTPNAGSPWPTVQALASTALSVGLNSLSVVAWPAKLLTGLLGAIEKVDVTLDQMTPGSSFYRSLTTSADPHVHYTVLAGNTSIIPAALEKTPGRQESTMERLMRTVLHKGTSLAFWGEPNDIAVSVASITSVPSDRTPAPVVRPVACDHITYFSTVAGLAALSEAVERVPTT